jgi:hypothetical protein
MCDQRTGGPFENLLKLTRGANNPILLQTASNNGEQPQLEQNISDLGHIKQHQTVAQVSRHQTLSNRVAQSSQKAPVLGSVRRPQDIGEIQAHAKTEGHPEQNRYPKGTVDRGRQALWCDEGHYEQVPQHRLETVQRVRKLGQNARGRRSGEAPRKTRTTRFTIGFHLSYLGRPCEHLFRLDARDGSNRSFSSEELCAQR